MDELIIKTERTKEVVDVTDRINEFLKKKQTGNSLVHLFLTHTTASLTTADLDPGTDLDMLDFFEAIIPKLNFRHPHDPSHVTDHILSSIIGTSLMIPVENGGLVLGTWQRIVLIEFAGPRERRIIISLI